MANRLKDEKSPYLLQHKDNPVDWYPWAEQAFQKAFREDKPIFLSIGYSTCHWCHVMAHESFEDEEVAGLLNEKYVSIKVDREERPDIDSVYMSVCQAVTGSGGWPLTIIMTPGQRPFFAGTYFPKRSRYGHPGLMDILENVAKLWQYEREELINAGEEIVATISKVRLSAYQEPSRELLDKACHLFRRQFDAEWGGFGGAPKFPAPHNLLFLMRYAIAETEETFDVLNMADTTLEAMARGGMYDHIGGGFSRYSTDEKWLVPHFEKMLYDNALLMLAYTEAYQVTRKVMYANIVRSTADYILRELTDKAGGFYCGQDADSDGVEGKYYVFTPEEIKEVLGETDRTEFCRLYGITEQGNFEGKSIPNRIGQNEGGWDSDDPRIKKLYEYRLGRAKLHKDDKILLSWNAWMILAFARAGKVFGEKRYIEAAVKAQKFIETNMTDEKNRLYVRFRDGEAAYHGQLEDYAVYALALLELYSVEFRLEFMKTAVMRAEQMQRYFEDRENGGYYTTASDAEKLIVRPKELYDGAIPSGNSVAAMLLQKLAYLTGDGKWQQAADRQMWYCAGKIQEYLTGHSFTLLAMADVIYTHRELVCAVKQGIPEKLINYLRNRSDSGLNVVVKTEENALELAKYASYTKDYPVPEEGEVYYLCENGVCRAPVREIEELGI